MPRKFQRQTPPVSEAAIASAIKAVKNGMKMRAAAKLFTVPRTTLQRRFQRIEKKQHNFQVFSNAQEEALIAYLLKSSSMHYGFTSVEVRTLAYQFAQKLNIRIPNTWRIPSIVNTGIAHREWFYGFLRRHKNISLRIIPQATSIGRAAAFNRHNVNTFFDQLCDLLNRLKIEKRRIFNMDETGITTVQKTDRVVSLRGIRQVGRIVSAERGKLLTMALAVSASGKLLPPFYVFPRARFKAQLLRDATPDSDGAANPFGWMTSGIFVKFLEHFRKHTDSSLENPSLLILDNHESHRAIEGIDYCRANGITMLTFPPHCTHRLQPLDRSVFGPFKAAMNKACDNYVRLNPGKPMAVEDIPSIAVLPVERSATESNILAGFRATGISPLDPDIFTDDDYMPAEVTERPWAPFEDEAEPLQTEAFVPTIGDIKIEPAIDIGFDVTETANEVSADRLHDEVVPVNDWDAIERVPVEQTVVDSSLFASELYGNDAIPVKNEPESDICVREKIDTPCETLPQFCQPISEAFLIKQESDLDVDIDDDSYYPSDPLMLKFVDSLDLRASASMMDESESEVEIGDGAEVPPASPTRRMSMEFVVEKPGADCDSRDDDKYHFKTYMSRHMSFNHGIGKSYCCYICGKKLAEKRSLMSHMISQHTGQFGFRCPACAKGFANKRGVSRHFKRTHAK